MATHQTLREKLESDLKNAMREKSESRVSVLRMAKAAVMNAEIATRLPASKRGEPARQEGGKGSFTDDDIISVIRKEAKKRQDSIVAFESGGRPDAADQERRELNILREYLPKMMDEAQVEEIVTKVIADIGSQKQDFGKVMKESMSRLGSNSDGATVSKMVKKLLAT